MNPIRITIAGSWLERLINACREDGMTDDIAWENAQQQVVRIIKKLVERREALASTEEDMIDNVRRDGSIADGILTGTSTAEHNAVQGQHQPADAGYARTPNHPPH